MRSRTDLQETEGRDIMESRQTHLNQVKTPRSGRRVLVIGAGVIGLTTARALVNNGYYVTILAKDFMAPDNPSKLTSQVAAAAWHIPVVAHGYKLDREDKIIKWCMSSYKQFSELAKDPQSTGVHMRQSVCLSTTMIKDTPRLLAVMKYHQELPGFRHSLELITEKGLTGVGFVDAFACTCPIIDTDLFLNWLTGQLLSKGVEFVRGVVSGPLRGQSSSLRHQYRVDWIVNCSGLGAKEVAEDNTVYPYRGCGIVVHNSKLPFQPLDHVLRTSTNWHDEENNGKGSFGLVPRGDHSLWIGTCMQETADRDISLAHPIVRRMMAENVSFYPALHRIPEHDMRISIGFRPMRTGGPRVEIDPECSRVIHNYGHCSIGIMLSMGCADSVIQILDRQQFVSKL